MSTPETLERIERSLARIERCLDKLLARITTATIWAKRAAGLKIRKPDR